MSRRSGFSVCNCNHNHYVTHPTIGDEYLYEGKKKNKKNLALEKGLSKGRISLRGMVRIRIVKLKNTNLFLLSVP